jgi:hypothetical protein
VPLTAAAWGVVQVWDGDDLAARWARPKERETAGHDRSHAEGAPRYEDHHAKRDPSRHLE